MSNIKTFLLARAIQDEAEARPAAGRPATQAAEFREEIERHHDRSMTVTWNSTSTVMTRCATCSKEPAWPCTALRRMALPYADHPAYLPEWRVS